MKAALSYCLILFVMTLAGCPNYAGYERSIRASGVQTGEYRKINAEEAKKMMDDGEAWILLDVRTQEEYSDRRIDGARLIPDYEIKGRAEAELPDKNARILVYCRSGRRSAQAAKDLAEMGYTKVYDFGGIIDWPYGMISDANP